jgi:hypothetical protein
MEFEALEIVRMELKYCERCGGLWMRTWERRTCVLPRVCYLAMKYLCEMIGLCPATTPESPLPEDSLAKTLLRRLRLPRRRIRVPKLRKSV